MLSGKSCMNIIEQVSVAVFHFSPNIREYKRENDWRKCKAHEDEEVAVGFVIQRYLQRNFVYHRLAHYEKLDDDYMMGG